MSADIIELCAKIAEPWPGFIVDENSTDVDRAIVAVRTAIAKEIRTLAALPKQEDPVALKPCPFCGGEPILLKDHKQLGFYVACTACHACTVTRAKPDAIEAWNARPSLDARESVNGELLATLREHHNWHMQSGPIGLQDGEGGWIEIDNGAEYSDSALYERTAKLLEGAPPEELQPIPRGGMDVWWWEQAVLLRRKVRALEKATRMREVLEEIAAERQRQIDVEGYGSEHDDQHTDGSIAKAAGCYAIMGAQTGDWHRKKLSEEWWGFRFSLIRGLWPWEWHYFKPRDTRSDLIRSGALIVAEIERIDRVALSSPVQSGGEP